MVHTKLISPTQHRGTKQLLTHPEWTFMNKSTAQYTHAIHLYPARMHPEIARRLISKYAPDTNYVVFDPFMGSGGVLLEAILHGNNAIGIDVNPFAVLLSKVKTTLIHKNLTRTLNNIILKSSLDISNLIRYYDELPKRLNVDAWYSSATIDMLTIIKHHVFNIRDLDVRDFFKICFSLTLRKSSYQRNGSWKLHRIPEKDRSTFKPDPISIFKNISENNINRMLNLINANPSGIAHSILGDSKDITHTFSSFNHNILEDQKVHLVVTSPPYGDHKTTVAYGQFSRHPGLWLDLAPNHVLDVDKVGLGGTMQKFDDLGSDTLNTTLDMVQKNDDAITKNKKPCRTREVYSFFRDLDMCMNEISSNLIPYKSHCCLVVSNRTVRRIRIPTDQIVIELGTKYGLKVKSIIPRDIPNKVLPMKNAPENIPHHTCETMTKEMVIIMDY